MKKRVPMIKVPGTGLWLRVVQLADVISGICLVVAMAPLALLLAVLVAIVNTEGGGES
jgi:hypothetical protein